MLLLAFISNTPAIFQIIVAAIIVFFWPLATVIWGHIVIARGKKRVMSQYDIGQARGGIICAYTSLACSALVWVFFGYFQIIGEPLRS